MCSFGTAGVPSVPVPQTVFPTFILIFLCNGSCLSISKTSGVDGITVEMKKKQRFEHKTVLRLFFFLRWYLDL